MHKLTYLTISIILLMLLSLAGPSFDVAATPLLPGHATTPGLGLAASFGILASTYTNTVGGTIINGDLGYTTGPAVAPTVNGTTHIANGTYNTAGTAQGVALAALNAQTCDFIFGSAQDLSALVQPLTPGVYCITGAQSVGSLITLNGAGTYIFRSTGALNTAANSIVTLTGGASACDVFWTPVATTLGANSTFAGTDIDDAGITIGSTVNWTGRALAFGGTVSTDVDTINVPICALPTATPTDTPTNTPTNTPTVTPTSEIGQLKVCKVAGTGVTRGQLFIIKVGNTSFSVPAGYCVLAGQFSLGTQVAIQETIPAGYYVSGIVVKPDSRTVSKDKAQGKAVIKIGSGVTEVIFTNEIIVPTPTGKPTPLATSTRKPTRTPTSTPLATSTRKPTRTPTSTPICAPNCTPTPTPIPEGRLQICKEADGAGVSGSFTFNFNTKTKTVPVGACTLLISVNAGILTVTENAQAGYAVSDIYTIPAGRLISENISARTVTVTIVQGTASSQTIVVFVNRAVTSQVNPNGILVAYIPDASPNDFRVLWNDFWQVILGSDR